MPSDSSPRKRGGGAPAAVRSVASSSASTSLYAASSSSSVVSSSLGGATLSGASLSLAALVAVALATAFALGAASSLALCRVTGACGGDVAGGFEASASAQAFASELPLAESSSNKTLLVAELWALDMNRHSVEDTAALYDSSALMYATFSTVLKTNHDIKLYLKKLFGREALHVRINKLADRPYENGRFGVNSGTYTFSYVENNETTTHLTSVPARFTFVYARDVRGDLKILEHHSSVDPEEMISVEPVETRARAAAD